MSSNRRPVYTADCETDPFKENRIPYPFIWGLFDGDNYNEFTDTDDFVDFVSKIPCIVYAHNGGKFDWFYILHRFHQFEPMMVINGRIASFKIGEAEFRDSYNILPIPLAAYQKDEIDYAIFEKSERKKPHNWKAIRHYLYKDCVYLHELVSRFVNEYGVKLTLASAALSEWRKMTGVKTPNTSASFYESIAPYYYGGRTQCFTPGIFEKDFKVIDINSAYPTAMKSLHPYGAKYSISSKLPKTDKFITRCFITLECISHGALPFRGANGLEFPDDDERRIYHVTGWEYLAGLRTNTIGNIKIIKVLQFKESISFDDYIDRFYKMKSQAKAANDHAGYIFAKLFLNSLYGKFGSNPEKYREYMVVNPHYIEAAEQDGYNYHALINKWALVSKPLAPEKQRYYNVAVSASITGFVRAFLWESICKCEGVMYCDTDSIVCESTGNLEIDPHTLGAWDVEAECDYAAIGGKKLYAFHDKTGKWKTATKGVRLTHDDIIKVCKGQTVTHTPENPSYSIVNGIRFISRNIKQTA